MSAAVFTDESPMGEALETFTLPDLPEQITARELVRLRVREEVARYNARPARRFRGLVRPEDAEAELNSALLPAPRHIDWERQAAAAERAFTRNGFVLLVGGRQVEDLDELVDLATTPEVTFIKLVPLAGG